MHICVYSASTLRTIVSRYGYSALKKLTRQGNQMFLPCKMEYVFVFLGCLKNPMLASVSAPWWANDVAVLSPLSASWEASPDPTALRRCSLSDEHRVWGSGSCWLSVSAPATQRMVTCSSPSKITAQSLSSIWYSPKAPRKPSYKAKAILIRQLRYERDITPSRNMPFLEHLLCALSVGNENTLLFSWE